MKRLIIVGMLLVAFSLAACGSKSEETQQAAKSSAASDFQSQFSRVLTAYFELKDALVASDAAAAAQKAGALKEALANVSDASLAETSRELWNSLKTKLQAAADELAGKTDITEQRAAFLTVSQSMITAVDKLHASPMTVYVQNCPMAFDNKGGDWLSDKKEVFNPYFGEGMMYRCGTVKMTFAAK